MTSSGRTARPGRARYRPLVALGIPLLILALAGCGEPEPTLENTVPELLTEADAQDVLPGELDPQAMNLDPGSVRFLGEEQDAHFWVAQSTTEEICLITFLPGDNWASGSTCTSLKTIHTHGQGTSTSTTSHSVAAYLLPADLDEESLKEATDGIGSGDQIQDTLLVIDPEGPGLPEEPIEIEREGRGTFVLQPL